MLSDKLDFSRRAVAFSICVFCLALPVTIAGANIAWGLLLLSLLAYAGFGGAIPWRAARGPLAKPLWIYLGVSILTAALGIDPLHSAHYLHQDVHKVWIYMLFSVALTLESAPEGLIFMAVGFAAAAAIGIGQTLKSMVDAGIWERAHAFVHPVTFGEQMSLALLGALCFLFQPKGLLKTAGSRIAALTVLLLTATALLLSKTQGALAAFIGGAIAIGLVLPRWRRRVLMALPIIFLLSIGALIALEKLRYGRSLITELLQWWQTGTLSNEGQLMRLTLWKVAWRMGLDHPWTGVGLNNYRIAFHQYFSGTLEEGARDWGTAHNLYLHEFAERGLVGIAALLLLLGTLWARAFQRARQSPDAWNLWAYGSATAFLIMNLTEVALQTEMVWMLMLFIWIWAEAREQARTSRPFV